jgi:hypothetical protein
MPEDYQAPLLSAGTPAAERDFRVEGAYRGWYTEGTDIVAMLARLGITTTHVFSNLRNFAAPMTDTERDRLRHESDLICIANDCWDSAY